MGETPPSESIEIESLPSPLHASVVSILESERERAEEESLQYDELVQESITSLHEEYEQQDLSLLISVSGSWGFPINRNIGMRDDLRQAHALLDPYAGRTHRPHNRNHREAPEDPAEDTLPEPETWKQWAFRHYNAISTIYPFTAIITGYLGLFFHSKIRNAVAVYDKSPDYDFSTCRVLVYAGTNEVLGDLLRGHILKKGHGLNSGSTYKQFVHSFNASSTSRSTAKITGEIVKFEGHNENCICPYCQKAGLFSQGNFQGCLVDVIIQRQVIVENLKDQFLNNKDNVLGDKMILEGNFLKFDTPEGVNMTAACRCQECPTEPTDESANIGEALTTTTGIVLSSIMATACYIAYLVYKHR